MRIILSAEKKRGHMRIVLSAVIILAIIFASGCVTLKAEDIDKTTPEEYCILYCKASIQQGQDISAGPCLSDEKEDWPHPDWVCDVAHSPRQDIDDQPENQCKAYRDGKAHHFVEVDTNCDLIRKV